MIHGQQLRIFFYVQHLLGIGHLMRANRIAIALREHDFHVTFVTGGLPVAGLDTTGMEAVALPPIAVRDGNFAELVDGDGVTVDQAYKDRRCRKLLDAFQASQPDIVMLEAFPFGRRQVRFELLPLIEAIEASVPKPVLVSSLRDILQRRSKPGRDEETVGMIKQHFDSVLVHGDPAFATLDESFPLTSQMQEKIAYTGWVSGPQMPVTTQRFDLVVSAGGGAVGLTLIEAALGAAKLLPDAASWCVITGPNLPDSEYADLIRKAPDNVTVERFRQDFPALLAGTQLSISQAGYNTVSDVIQAGCRSLLVPYSAQGETEQTDRAERLQQLELATMIKPEELSSDTLAMAIRDLLGRDTRTDVSIESNGAERTAEILRELVEMRC